MKLRFKPTSLFVVMLFCTAIFSQAPAGDIKVISSVEPVFPAEASNYVYGDSVKVSMSVDKAGRVRDAKVSGFMVPCKKLGGDATTAAIQKAAGEAARSVVFEPMLKDGQPSEFGVTMIPPLRPQTEPAKIDDSAPVNAGGGILKNAISLPKPPYPNSARAGRLGGTTTMKILVDEDGSVLSTAGLAGHPYLIEASLETACKAKFSKTVQNGKPMKAWGIIVYNFVP